MELEVRQSSSAPNSPPELTYFDFLAATGRDVSGLLSRIWRHKIIFFFLVLLCLLGGVYVAAVSKPIYRAEAILAPRTAEGSNISGLLASRLGGLSSLVGGLPANQSTAELAVALTTRDLIYRFMDKSDIKQALFPDLWDDQSNQWKLSVRRGLSGAISESIRKFNGQPPLPPQFGPTKEDVYTKLLKKLDVSQDQQGNLIHLTMDWDDPVKAAAWINGLVDLLNEIRRQSAIAVSDARVKFLQSQLQATTAVDMRSVLYNLIQSETESIVVANSEPQFALRFVDRAVPPQDLVWPLRGLIVVLSLLCGVILGGIVSLTWDAFGHARRRADQRGIKMDEEHWREAKSAYP